MVIIKYIGLFLIFSCSSYIGILIAKNYDNRVRELKDMKTALNIFETKVSLTYEPVPEIFKEIGRTIKSNIGSIFETASNNMENMDAEKSWKESLDSVENSMNKEDIEVLYGLGNLLGQVDAEGQISRIRMIDSFLNSQIDKAEFSRKKNEKLYKTLGVTLGLTLVILLV